MNVRLWAVARHFALLALCSHAGNSQTARQLPASNNTALENFALYGLRQTAGRPCASLPAYRAVDFLHGRWRITRPDGTQSGRSVITSELDGCATLEHFAGGEGRSLTVYDPIRQLWYQDYVDVRGLTLRLIGRRDRDSVFMGDSIRSIPQGPSLRSRFSWVQNPNGAGFRQRWWFSVDSGKTETLNFDGIYQIDSAVGGPPAPQAGQCRDRPVYRTLDALLGEWTVSDANNAVVGTASVTLRAGDCLVEERFTGKSGYRSIAFVYYDRYLGRWNRVQADTRGTLVRQAGGATNDIMDLNGSISDERTTFAAQLQLRLGMNVATAVWRANGDSVILNWKRR